MRIVVTKEDIEKGRRQDPKGCPIGRALSRAGVNHCCVAGAAVILRNEPQQVTALLLPDVVRNWIFDFDRGKTVEPIGFEVGLPVKALCHCRGQNGGGSEECPAARNRLEPGRPLD